MPRGIPNKPKGGASEEVLPDDRFEDDFLVKEAERIFEVPPPMLTPDEEEDGPKSYLDPDHVVDMVTGEIKPVGDANADIPFGEPGKPVFQPKREWFTSLGGKARGAMYLPARRRIQWMRGEVGPQPDWGIDTIMEEMERGKWDPVLQQVTGGYVLVRAAVYDRKGRLIATGVKSEYSERFPDFIEKAETGAIARALAVAGFGTESALDLDEGFEVGRIADSPVSTRGVAGGRSGGPVGPRPISITSSAIPGIKAGGRSEVVTPAQIKEITRLSRALGLGMGITSFIEAATDGLIGGESEATTQKELLELLKTLSFEQAATIVQALSKAYTNKEDAE